PVLQAVTAAILLLAGFYIIRTRGDAARERLWAGMARESAHQLGTPLSSLSGWVELLEDSEGDDRGHAAARHMRADLERLDRVGHRPFARQAHRRGESRRPVGPRADGARRDVRDYSSLRPDGPTGHHSGSHLSTSLENQLTAGLNPAQREAVLHTNGPLLVL